MSPRPGFFMGTLANCERMRECPKPARFRKRCSENSSTAMPPVSLSSTRRSACSCGRSGRAKSPTTPSSASGETTAGISASTGHWGKLTNYEDAARSPLILSDPRADFGRQGECAHRVSGCLSDALRNSQACPDPSTWRARAWLPILRGDQAAVHEAAITQMGRRAGEDSRMGWAIRTQRYRYIEWRPSDLNSDKPSFSGKVEAVETVRLRNGSAGTTESCRKPRLRGPSWQNTRPSLIACCRVCQRGTGSLTIKIPRTGEKAMSQTAARTPAIAVVGACNIDLISYVPRMPVLGETLHGTRFQMGVRRQRRQPRRSWPPSWALR